MGVTQSNTPLSIGLTTNLSRCPCKLCRFLKVEAHADSSSIGKFDPPPFQLTPDFRERSPLKHGMVCLETLYRSIGNARCGCQLCLSDPEQIPGCRDLRT